MTASVMSDSERMMESIGSSGSSSRAGVWGDSGRGDVARVTPCPTHHPADALQDRHGVLGAGSRGLLTAAAGQGGEGRGFRAIARAITRGVATWT